MRHPWIVFSLLAALATSIIAPVLSAHASGEGCESGSHQEAQTDSALQGTFVADETETESLPFSSPCSGAEHCGSVRCHLSQAALVRSKSHSDQRKPTGTWFTADGGQVFDAHRLPLQRPPARV